LTCVFVKPFRLKKCYAAFALLQYSQEFGFDFNETYALVVRIKQVRILFALAAYSPLHSYMQITRPISTMLTIALCQAKPDYLISPHISHMSARAPFSDIDTHCWSVRRIYKGQCLEVNLSLNNSVYNSGTSSRWNYISTFHSRILFS